MGRVPNSDKEMATLAKLRRQAQINLPIRCIGGCGPQLKAVYLTSIVLSCNAGRKKTMFLIAIQVTTAAANQKAPAAQSGLQTCALPMEVADWRSRPVGAG